MELEIPWPAGWLDTLLTGDEQKETKRSAVKDQRMLNGIEAQTAVVKAGKEFWRNAKAWGTTKERLTATESGILDVAASVPAKIPSEKQCIRAIETLRKRHLAHSSENRHPFQFKTSSDSDPNPPPVLIQTRHLDRLAM